MEKVPPPYGETGILNPEILNSWTYDITRENQLLSVNSEFPSAEVLRQSMLLPFLMSGHHVEVAHFRHVSRLQADRQTVAL